ncbi:MAG: M48 family metallopeptidase [Pseudomonadota bacterium]
MDFFEAQDQARKQSGRMVVLFGSAVLAIIVLTNLLVMFAGGLMSTTAVAGEGFRVDWGTVATITILVLLLIGGASLFRIAALNRGGSAVAEMMGGTLLVNGRADARQKRLMNVVEEMAIASGTPVPQVYLIEDNSINAFAAGYAAGDAVIGVTTGALESLNREQLQGVIAHEFSHILNGDMRLNIRLMGVLYGILVLAIVGRMLLYSGGRSSRSGAPVLATAVGLLVIGYVGQFFGNWIKASVSRQREYLADASAVQFTRNPQGIAGALKRIGGYTGGSRLSSAKAEELSHAFFAEGVKLSFRSLMATHPPLDERITRIEPGWQGQMMLQNAADDVSDAMPQTASGAASGMASGFAGNAAASGSATTATAADVGPTVAVDADALTSAIGQPAESHLDYAARLLDEIPPVLRDAVHDPFSARAVMYLLLIDNDPLVRARQLAHLEQYADPAVWTAVQSMSDIQAATAWRLPLLELALPALRQLSESQLSLFLENVDVLIRADSRIQLSEWVMQKLLRKHLMPPDRKDGTLALGQCADACGTLLSMLANADHRSTIPAEQAFDGGATLLPFEVSLKPRDTLKLSVLDGAIDQLTGLHPLQKPKLLKACISVVAADNRLALVESELLRAVADSLDCPMPPIPDLQTA